MKIKSVFVQTMLRLFGARMFNHMLLQTELSPTYGLFCEKVYGRNLGQANMLDEVQLQALLSVANLSQGQEVLDLGCGSGKISEFISDQSGAHVLGVDFAKDAIVRAQQRTQAKAGKLSYQIGNLNALSLQHKTFDVIVAIDSLYFVNNLKDFVGTVRSHLKPDGKFLVFYTSRFIEGMPIDLAEALQTHGFKFQTWDFSSYERQIWEKTLKYAHELKDSFALEGNRDIFKGRVREAQQNILWQKEGRMRRSLYLASPTLPCLPK